MDRIDSRTIAVAIAGSALLGVILWARWSESEALPVGNWPTVEELDSLGRYLEPSDPAPPLDDYAVFLPAEPEPYFGEPSGPLPQVPAPELELSAILTGGSRPVAIINDQPVRPGAKLPGGSILLAIAPDHVVIRDPGGAQRRVFLRDG